MLRTLQPPAAALATGYARIERLVAAVGSYVQSKKGDGSLSIKARATCRIVGNMALAHAFSRSRAYGPLIPAISISH